MSLIDQNMKRLGFSERDALKQTHNFDAYVQCPFYDETRCLIALSVFPSGAKPNDKPVIGRGFYVPRRGVGGISWDIDVVPIVRDYIQKYLKGEVIE